MVSLWGRITRNTTRKSLLESSEEIGQKGGGVHLIALSVWLAGRDKRFLQVNRPPSPMCVHGAGEEDPVG